MRKTQQEAVQRILRQRDYYRQLLADPPAQAFIQEMINEAQRQDDRALIDESVVEAPERWAWLVSGMVRGAASAVVAGDASSARLDCIRAAAVLMRWAQIAPDDAGDSVELMREQLADPAIKVLRVLIEDVWHGRYTFPFKWEDRRDEGRGQRTMLIVRTTHVMTHMRRASHLRGLWDGLTLHSPRTLKKRWREHGLLIEEHLERSVGGFRLAHAVGVDVSHFGAIDSDD